MSANENSPSSAIERAHRAYEEMQRRQSNAAMKQRARDRSRNIKVAIGAAFMIAVVLGLSFQNGWLTNSIRTTGQSNAGRLDHRFDESREAPIRSFVKGNTCQQMQFNNDLGIYVRGALVPCEAESKREPLALPNQPYTPPPLNRGPRIDAVRDSFSR
jgi:hypothetical protein